MRPRRSIHALVCTTLAGLGLACVMDNPAFDVRDEIADDSSTGDGDPSTGDGDPSTGDGDPSTGDGDPSTGDGDPSTGDGDGEAESSTGDGDGDAPCPTGQEPCDGGCIDPLFDNDNCGGCGSPCPGTHLCSEGSCSPKKYVFVGKAHSGAFGGIAGADELCAGAAASAQLEGQFKAWLSDLEQSPTLTFSQQGVYTLRGGPVVAWSWEDLTDGQLLAPINKDEFGQAIEPMPACEIDYAVWTGTAYDGSEFGPSCAGWTVSAEQEVGRVGNAAATGTGWSGSDCTAPCYTELGIYCVQQ